MDTERADDIYRVIGALGFYWMHYPDKRLLQVLGDLLAETDDSYFMSDTDLFELLTAKMLSQREADD